MRRFLSAAFLAVSLAALPLSAHAQERLVNGALGAGAGALVGGPVGAVAGGVVGYGAGRQISRGLGLSGPRYRRRAAYRRHGADRRYSHR